MMYLVIVVASLAVVSTHHYTSRYLPGIFWVFFVLGLLPPSSLVKTGLDKFDDDRRAGGMLKPIGDKKLRALPVRRDGDTYPWKGRRLFVNKTSPSRAGKNTCMKPMLGKMSLSLQ